MPVHGSIKLKQKNPLQGATTIGLNFVHFRYKDYSSIQTTQTGLTTVMDIYMIQQR